VVTDDDKSAKLRASLARITGDDEDSFLQRESIRALAAKFDGVWLERDAADQARIVEISTSQEFWDGHVRNALLVGRTNAQIAEWLGLPEDEVARWVHRLQASDEAERRAAR
jgi:CRP-like cAMP-binding protein